MQGMHGHLPSRSGTWLDAAICAAIGLLAVAAGLVADAAGGATTVVAATTAVVALAGLALDRRDRGRPVVDPYELGARVGYRRQMALKITPVAACGAWIVAVASAVEGLGVASGEVGEVTALATVFVPYAVTERLVARRVAPRAAADDLALATRVQERLPSGPSVPDAFGWNRPRQLALLLPFAAVTVACLTGAALATSSGGRVLGILGALLFGFVAVGAVRLVVTDVAIAAGVQGATFTGFGTAPWEEIQALAIRRESFALYLDVLTEGPRPWMSRAARRQAARRSGVLSVPLLMVDAAPEDVLAALHHRLPDVPVMLPGPAGAPTVL